MVKTFSFLEYSVARTFSFCFRLYVYVFMFVWEREKKHHRRNWEVGWGLWEALVQACVCLAWALLKQPLFSGTRQHWAWVGQHFVIELRWQVRLGKTSKGFWEPQSSISCVRDDVLGWLSLCVYRHNCSKWRDQSVSPAPEWQRKFHL